MLKNISIHKLKIILKWSLAKKKKLNQAVVIKNTRVCILGKITIHIKSEFNLNIFSYVVINE